jgi:hypothetical protein
MISFVQNAKNTPGYRDRSRSVADSIGENGELLLQGVVFLWEMVNMF